MSNSTQSAGISDTDHLSAMPRAMIHKRILDAAAANPTASLETLAAEVMGASTGLVERVLDEYGDPAAQPTNAETEPIETTESDDQYESSPANTDVSMTEQDAQDAPERDTATAIEPAITTATGEDSTTETESDATTATADFTELSEKQQATPPATGPSQPALQALTEQLDALSQHLAILEHRLDKQGAPSQSVFADPALAHKLAHACLTSEAITEDEELQILKGLITQPV